MVEASELFARVLGAYRKFVYFPQEWSYKIISLFVMQSYIFDALSNVWYVGLIGPKASGKSTVLEVTAELCNGGSDGGSDRVALSANMSPAAMARMAETHILFIDELDELKGEALEVAQGVLRSGYRRGMSYIRCEGKDFKPHPYKVFGPKAYSIRSEAEDALMTRTYGIMTGAPPPAEIVRLHVDNVFRFEELESIATALREWATQDVMRDLRANFKKLWQSAGFRERLEKLVGAGALPRDLELAATCLSTAEVLGIDIEADINGAMSEQDAYRDDEVDEFRFELYTLWDTIGRPAFVKRMELRGGMNERRAAKREAAIGKKMFSKHLREAGARDGKEIRRLGRGLPHAVFFTPELVRLLEQQAHSEPHTDPHTDDVSGGMGVQPNHDGTSMHINIGLKEEGEPFTSVSAQPPLNRPLLMNMGVQAVNLEARPRNSVAVFTAVRDLMEGLGAFTLEDVAQRAALIGITGSEVREILSRLRGMGRVIEPRPDSGTYRFVGSGA